jgi:IclR family acetate operon transcriptional repressor
MPPTGRPAERRLAAVERALRVLDAFLEAGGEAGTNELARLTGINASTVSRLLGTLAAHGYVERAADTGRYRLGGHLLRLGDAVLEGRDVRALARPHLVALERETGETATLSVAGGTEAVTVDFVASRASVMSVARVGRTSVAHATATGKVMLAFGDAEPPAGPLERHTGRTITDPARLAEEVAQVRARGWAQAEGEREPDLNAVAAPVLDRRGALAAILGVQGPAGRFDAGRRRAALAPLLEEAAALSRRIGGGAAAPVDRPGQLA